MEIKVLNIDSVIRFHGIRLKVVKQVQGCRGCYFRRMSHCDVTAVGACCMPYRKEDVIFRKYDENRKENLHSKH